MSTYLWRGRIFGDSELEQAVRESLDCDRVLALYAEGYGFVGVLDYLGRFYCEVPEAVRQLGIDPGAEDAGFTVLSWYSENGGEDIVTPIWQAMYEAAVNGTPGDLFAITGIRTLSSGRGTA